MDEVVEIGLVRDSCCGVEVIPEIHIFKKGLMPGTSSRRPLIEEAI